MFRGIVKIGKRLFRGLRLRIKGPRKSSKKLRLKAMEQDALPSPPPLAALEALRNFSGVQLSSHTKRAYERDLKDFCFYLKKGGAIDRWHELSPSDVAAYRDELIRQGFAKTSVTRKVAVLKSFFSWTVAQGYLQRNPVDTVRSFPQSQESKTGFLTEEQVYALLDYLEGLDAGGRLSYHLAKVGISLLLMLGVRRSEACALRYEDLSLVGDQWTLRVQGKGGRDRKLPVAPRLAETLSDWFRRLHPEECPGGIFESNPEGWLDFLRRRSEHPLLISTRATTPDKALSDGELARIVRKHCLKAGIPFRVSPHMLRSTAITHALDEGATHRGIQQMAGWTSPLMIARYDKKRMDPKYSAIHSLRYAKQRGHSLERSSPDLSSVSLANVENTTEAPA